MTKDLSRTMCSRHSYLSGCIICILGYPRCLKCFVSFVFPDSYVLRRGSITVGRTFVSLVIGMLFEFKSLLSSIPQ